MASPIERTIFPTLCWKAQHCTALYLYRGSLEPGEEEVGLTLRPIQMADGGEYRSRGGAGYWYRWGSRVQVQRGIGYKADYKRGHIVHSVQGLVHSAWYRFRTIQGRTMQYVHQL
jgi:hypothetical protein